MKKPAATTLVLIALTLGACNSSQSAATTSTETETNPTTTLTLEPALDSEPWSMESTGPGTFHTTRIESGLTFSLDEGWLPIFPEGPDILSLRLPETAFLFVLTSNATSVDNFLASVSSTLTLSSEESVAVGGIEGLRYEVEGTGGVLSQSSVGEFTVDPLEEAPRVTVLDISGSIVAVVEIAPLDSVDAARTASQAVIDSITWDNT